MPVQIFWKALNRRLQDTRRRFYSAPMFWFLKPTAGNKSRHLGSLVTPLLCVAVVTSLAFSQETSTITSTTGPGDLEARSHRHRARNSGQLLENPAWQWDKPLSQFQPIQRWTWRYRGAGRIRLRRSATLNILVESHEGNPSRLFFRTITHHEYPVQTLSLSIQPVSSFAGSTGTLLGGSGSALYHGRLSTNSQRVAA